MIDVQFLKEIHEFCDTTRLLYKWSIHHRKFNTLQILMSSFDVHGMYMATMENSYNLIAIMKRYLSKILLWERCSHSISYVGTPMRSRPTTPLCCIKVCVFELLLIFAYLSGEGGGGGWC